MVKVFEIDPVPGGFYDTSLTALATATVDEKGNFTLTFSWPSGGTGYKVGGPDLIFEPTQNINGSFETIYEEKPSTTHWNVVDGCTLTFTYDINNLAKITLNVKKFLFRSNFTENLHENTEKIMLFKSLSGECQIIGQ